ncbi:unnamed protein product [marine sediment metagenome]|uniref:Uncharacterized protein n=1 Tax=marine sediment metagenome TaxID=412755 RepID=X1A1F3_9ZZZZ
MNPSKKFENLINSSRADFMEAVGASNWVGRELTREEADLIIRGFDAGLLSFDGENGKFNLVGFAPNSKGETKSYELFSYWKTNAYWVWQELFIQIGFATELALDWNWPPKLIAFESCGFDIVAFRDERPALMVEAKVAAKDLDEQMRVFLNGAVDGSSTDINRYADLQNFQPEMYAGVALGTRRYFRLTVKQDSQLEFSAKESPLLYHRD